MSPRECNWLENPEYVRTRLPEGKDFYGSPVGRMRYLPDPNTTEVGRAELEKKIETFMEENIDKIALQELTAKDIPLHDEGDTSDEWTQYDVLMSKAEDPHWTAGRTISPSQKKADSLQERLDMSLFSRRAKRGPKLFL